MSPDQHQNETVPRDTEWGVGGAGAVWGATVLSTLRLGNSLIVEVAGGSWRGERMRTVFLDGTLTELVRAEEIFGELQGVLSGADLVVAKSGRLLSGGGYLGGVWAQACERAEIPGAPEVALAEKNDVLATILAGEALGLVMAATITSMHGRGEKRGITVEGGRLVEGGLVTSLVEQRGEMWFRMEDHPGWREAATAGVGAIGEACFISDGRGSALAIHDATGTVEGRRVLFRVS